MTTSAKKIGFKLNGREKEHDVTDHFRNSYPAASAAYEIFEASAPRRFYCFTVSYSPTLSSSAQVLLA